MKIYRVVSETGQTQSIWDNYRSAVTSRAQRLSGANWSIEVADVPAELWQPADSAAESQARRLEGLWWRLNSADPSLAEEILGRLMVQAERVKHVRGHAARVLGEQEREEAAVLLEMDRLVDAK